MQMIGNGAIQMETWIVDVQLTVEADTQIQAFDMVNALLNNSNDDIEVSLSKSVSNELFNELGVQYD